MTSITNEFQVTGFVDFYNPFLFFRLDFHLVQLFFVCMPSLGLLHDKLYSCLIRVCFGMPNVKLCVLLYVYIVALFWSAAVYLVAQYARREIKRMEAVIYCDSLISAQFPLE